MEESGVKLNADSADAFIKAMDRAADAMQRFTVQGEAASRVNFDPKVDGVDNAKGKLGELDEAGEKSAQKAKRNSDLIGNAFKAAAGVIAVAAAAAVAAAGAFAIDGVKAAGDLEQKLNVLKVTAGATDSEMEKVRQTSIALGADMTLPGVSAASATDAMLELAKAGFTVDEAMAASKGTLQLATAAQVDAATAAQMSAGALQAFGLKADKASYVADLLANGANASSASMTDLSDALKQGGFAFHAAGQNIDDLVASTAILTNVGIGGSDAGTALKNAFIRLMDPTKEAKKLMAELGLNFYDANGKMLPMRDIIGQLNDKLGGMTDEQRNSALSTIFLSDGMKAMIPLMAQGVTGYDKMKESVNRQGAAQELAAAQMEGWNGAMAAAKNIVDTLALTIGGYLLPMLTQLMNEHITPAITEVLNFATAFTEAEDKLAFITQALLPAGEGVAAFSEQFPLVQQVVESAFGAYQAIVDNVLPVIQGFIAEHGDEIVAVLQSAWEIIQKVINVVLMFLDKFIFQQLSAIAKFIGENQEQVKSLFTNAWNAIRAFLSVIFAIINGVLQTAMALMQGDTNKALKAIQTMFNDIWNGIKAFVEGVLLAIKDAIDLKLREAGTSVDTELGKINAKFNDIWNGIKSSTASAFESVKKSIIEPVQAALRSLGDLVGSFTDVGRRIVEGIINGIKALGQSIADTLGGYVQRAVDIALGVIADVRAKVDALFGLIQRAKDFVNGVVNPSSTKGASVQNTSSVTNQYNLTVASSTSPAVVIQSFDVMKAFA